MTHTQAFDDGWLRKAQAMESMGRHLRRHLRDALHDPRTDPATNATADDGSERHSRGREHRPGWRSGGREFGRGGPEFGRGGPFGFGGPFGPFGPGRGGRGGNRARRGDVRAAALILLAEEPRNGYQLIQELANRSDGAWRASPGSVYPALQQLEDEGLIRAVTDDGRKLMGTDRRRSGLCRGEPREARHSMGCRRRRHSGRREGSRRHRDAGRFRSAPGGAGR